MPPSYIGRGLSSLIALGIVFIGVRFLVAPLTAARAYGVAVERPLGPGGAYLSVKGVRDIASGVFVAILTLAATAHLLGAMILAGSIIPIGDALIVLTHGGRKAIAYGVHGTTAAVMLGVAGMLLISNS